jgi:hypothetical protein
MNHDAAMEQERNAKHHLLTRMRNLEKATADEIQSVLAGNLVSLKGINRRWLAVDEATTIYRACVEAVDTARLRESA